MGRLSLDAGDGIRVGSPLEPGPEGSWTVPGVFPGTDAAAEGLKEGETVFSIDGTEVASLDSGQVDALLGGHRLGEELPVGVERDGGVETPAIAVEDRLSPSEAP